MGANRRWVGNGIRSHGQVDYLIQVWDLMDRNFVVEGHVTGHVSQQSGCRST